MCVGVQVQGFQVNALMRKSWAYQRKNVSMNICILMCPIITSILLGVLQVRRSLDRKLCGNFLMSSPTSIDPTNVICPICRCAVPVIRIFVVLSVCPHRHIDAATLLRVLQLTIDRAVAVFM